MQQSQSADSRLLQALAEQLKIPLMQIARQAELANQKLRPESFETIIQTADMAIRLVDGFLLSANLHQQTMFEFQPVSVSAVLQDAVYALQPVASQYNCRLQLDIAGKYQPVMAHAEGLRAALTLLGLAFIESCAPSNLQPVVTLGAHRSSQGIVAGIYSDGVSLSADSFRRGIALVGSATQPFSEFSSSSSSSLFVAESLCQAFASGLKVSRHSKRNGLATTLLPSQQLMLV